MSRLDTNLVRLVFLQELSQVRRRAKNNRHNILYRGYTRYDTVRLDSRNHTHTQPITLTLSPSHSHPAGHTHTQTPQITLTDNHTAAHSQSESSRNIHSRNLNMLPSPLFDFKLLYWAIYRSKVLISVDKSSLQAHKKINGMKFERNCNLSEFWAHFLSFFLRISLP